MKSNQSRLLIRAFEGVSEWVSEGQSRTDGWFRIPQVDMDAHICIMRATLCVALLHRVLLRLPISSIYHHVGFVYRLKSWKIVNDAESPVHNAQLFPLHFQSRVAEFNSQQEESIHTNMHMFVNKYRNLSNINIIQ